MIPPKEELFSFQRWEASSFDRKPAPATNSAGPEQVVAAQAAPEIPDHIPLPTVDEIERMHEEARTSGFEAGLAEGKTVGETAAREAIEANAQRYVALIGNLEIAIADIEQSVAQQLLALAIEIAAQLTRGSIAANTELLLPIVREAIACLPVHHTNLVLRLNPVDAENIRAQLIEQFAQTSTRIIEDREITPGGCMLQAGPSEVDATIETRWKRVLEAIGTEPQKWLTP